MYQDRILFPALHNKIMSAAQAATLIQHGMVLGLSGFTRAGDAKAIPAALVERAKQDPFKVTIMTGASLGHGSDGAMTNAGIIEKRLPFQVDTTLRQAINKGDVLFVDQHLSSTVERLRSHALPEIDVAVIEAVQITEQGHIIPTMSVGNSAFFAQHAKKIIIELNTSVPTSLSGIHDIYDVGNRPNRQPIPMTSADQRIGISYIEVDPSKIEAIVITDKADSPSNALPPDEETQSIANHIIRFLENEVNTGHLPDLLPPLQAGIGTIANAVLGGLQASSFKAMSMYSEVLQDSAIQLIDSGKLSFASASSITLTAPMYQHFIDHIDQYKDKVLLRPQEISNHPEIIRRLGLIAINTALEFDIYGNVNSTHVCGTKMMNGIGGSGDFARNAQLSIFVTKSIAKEGAISSIVPMVSHVDHTEHDVDIVVTECGLADLRGLAPRERAPLIIKNCVHPDYQAQLMDYYQRACQLGGHTPHILSEALSWHTRFLTQKTMKI